jgi:hypothetical protein
MDSFWKIKILHRVSFQVEVSILRDFHTTQNMRGSLLDEQHSPLFYGWADTQLSLLVVFYNIRKEIFRPKKHSLEVEVFYQSRAICEQLKITTNFKCRQKKNTNS